MPDTQIATDISYKDGLALDVYGEAKNDAAIMLIHGGGWFQGDKGKEKGLANMLAEAGFIVFVPNYSLAPAHLYPAGRDDLLAAITWVLASDFRFDRERLAVWGGSAGGNLSVECAIATGRPAVSWSGLLDLKGAIEETDNTPAADAHVPDPTTASGSINQKGRDDAFLRWCILDAVGGDRSKLAEATPINRVTSACGPIYMANSTDEFVHETDPVRMQAALCRAGVASVVQFVPGKAHAEGYLDKAFEGSLQFVSSKLRLPR